MNAMDRVKLATYHAGYVLHHFWNPHEKWEGLSTREQIRWNDLATKVDVIKLVKNNPEVEIPERLPNSPAKDHLQGVKLQETRRVEERGDGNYDLSDRNETIGEFFNNARFEPYQSTSWDKLITGYTVKAGKGHDVTDEAAATLTGALRAMAADENLHKAFVAALDTVDLRKAFTMAFFEHVVDDSALFSR